MFRITARWMKKVINLRAIALASVIFIVCGVLGYYHLSEFFPYCDSTAYHHINKKQISDAADIAPEVLSQLKKRWVLEYEEERKENENGKLINRDDVKGEGLQQAVSAQFDPIDCIINDDYPVNCIREKDGDAESVFMPWTFIEKYFEVYGKLKHFDGYDRFEFLQSYAKIVYDSKNKYSHNGVFLTFETYNVESRDRVKCITGIEGVPLSTQWGPQGYFYPIQISQFGLSHYSKNITEKPPRQTVYEDGERQLQAVWKSTNNHCVFENVLDNERKSRVIKFTTPDTLPYGSGVSLTLGNTMESVLSFDIKFTTNASITVVLDTTEKGKQYYIHYTTSKFLLEYDKDASIRYGIGERRTWSHFSRDLLVDLRKGVGLTNTRNVKKSKIAIRKVVKLILRGSGYIDNIMISTTDHTTPFQDACSWLMKNQNPETGGWPIMVERRLEGLPPLAPGWHSSMAQGHALSTLVRGYRLTRSKEQYMRVLRKAILPFTVDSSKGGVRAVFMGKYVWYEEYPTVPSSFVLNGFIYSLLGLYDFKSLLEEERQHGTLGSANKNTYETVRKLYDDGMTSLKNMLPLYDSGSRTIYDLRHLELKTQPNIARWDYHTTHMSQLALVSTIDDDPIFLRFFGYWNGYMKGQLAKHN